ncbi:MAG: class I SAM-dependent methyltransferase [Myxococcota bacterium]|nr:class I SAM-dependent methyltransferase [Myxococcota bacterium]
MARIAQLARFLSPRALPWTLSRAWELLSDRVTGAPPRVERVRRFVEEHAKEGDPQDVLRTIDRFAREKRFLMNVGPEKGPLMAELIARLPANARALELGAYCGYSAIMIADQLGPEGRLTSIEVNADAARASRANVAYAGYADKVDVLEGSSSELIPTLEGPFDLVFLDHWKDLYERDLRLLEDRGLLRTGSIVVADNVGELFGADAYLHYVRTCGRYDSEHREAHIEYSDLPDAVEISVFRGQG